MKMTLFLLVIIFIISVLTVIQPLSREALANTTVPNANILQLEQQTSEKNLNAVISENTPTGETKVPTPRTNSGTTGNIVAENEPSTEEPTYPVKVGTVSVVGGGTTSTGSLG